MPGLAPLGRQFFFAATSQFSVNGRRLSCLAALIALAWAPGASGACTLDVAGQSLDEALQEIARQCGVQLIYFSEITQGLRAPSLKGEYTVEVAIRSVLAGTGLVSHLINAQTVEIRPLPSQQARRRAPRDLEGPASGKPEDEPEVVVTGTAEGLVATRIATPLRDIPQTISIIPPEQIREQNDTDLADALVNAVGVTAVRADSVNQQFYSRGFPITTFHLDGGAPLHSLNYSDFNTNIAPLFLNPDLGEYDRIEVLRGADALFGANGDPGATVNLVRKRPLETPTAVLTVSGGSWRNYRAEADVTGPLAFDGALRGRLDVVYGQRDYFYERANLQRKKAFGVLEADLTASTLLAVGGSYSWDRALPFEGGLPMLGDGTDAHLPRSTSYTFDWGVFHTQTREAYLRLEQKFGDSWRLVVNTTSMQSDADYSIGEFTSGINPITRGIPSPPAAIFTLRPSFQNQFSLEVTLTGNFELLGRRIFMAMGGDYAHFRGNSLTESISTFGPPLADAYHYNPASYPDPRPRLTLPFETRQASIQSGLFASVQAQLTDPWSVTAGLRVSNDRNSSFSATYIPQVSLVLDGTPRSYVNVGKITPYAGTLYALNDNYSLYASYADIYLSNDGAVRSDGGLLPPADGDDTEIGVKGSWRDAMLTGSLALYDIVQSGVAVEETVAPINAPGCCYVPSGKNRSRGLDLELSGRPFQGWQLGVGYTFNNNVQRTLGRFDNGALSARTPRHLLKLWTATRLPGALSRWTVGGTVHAQSSNSSYGAYHCPLVNPVSSCSSSFPYFRVMQGPYVVVSPRIEYDIEPHWRVALTVNNLFDRVYYQTISSPLYGNWYGDPRNFLVSVEARF
jgi:outer-membrane receptor for ferric coprogen and ferric-rhodotorulic acid